MKYKPVSTVCSNPGCDRLRRPKQRTCAICHAAYMRQWRAERMFVRREDVERKTA